MRSCKTHGRIVETTENSSRSLLSFFRRGSCALPISPDGSPLWNSKSELKIKGSNKNFIRNRIIELNYHNMDIAAKISTCNRKTIQTNKSKELKSRRDLLSYGNSWSLDIGSHCRIQKSAKKPSQWRNVDDNVVVV